MAALGIDVRHRPYWEAVHEVCGAFGARPAVMLPDGIELVPNPFWAKRPWRLVPGGLMVFESAERLSDREAEVGRDPRRRIRLRFEFYADPAYRGLTHTHTLNTTEAIDEHGQSLVPQGQVRPMRQQRQWHIQLRDRRRPVLDAKMATRLVSSRRTPDCSSRRRGADRGGPLAKAREVVRTAAGVRLTVHRCDRIPGGWSVNVTAERAGMPLCEWELARELYFPLGPRLSTSTAIGRVGPPGQGRDRKIGAERVDGPVHFLHTEGPDAAANAAAPAKFVWDLPADTKELEIPVEFKDLPLP